ncbi:MULTISPECIES: CDF family cation-efflux transporter FieF [unclassified Salinivibrio]|uniref:CDF family cation-efflux transporter FieF n=1 Tax=unclassified Salinivibrio TaxID=2636825 RepID=UPI00128BCF73|nr:MULTISPECIES: CDF family cation-efflux transporter FieF [unclassified Salinivibrio]MPS32662.1 CDF family cation-efflux pump FieF [Salinivibrio sp. VYel7]MPX90796.1 CDF family cation-efflux pump FieF [Salinivibrio sp. VYel1]MPX94052.1 CDF family cation-efflux pump FieF [Salinivibrio sp. VYel9]MPX96760.1 CDF family cation-efflux pump FieF [Salinivibrio sp. VYel6]MPY00088.1 CDF family cation-efflux pump FieF [Salinivibrio sp. VYel4]
MTKKYAFWVEAAAWAATCVAALLLLAKLIAWWLTGSVSVLASFVDSLLDLLASLTNLLVVRYAVQPADSEHSFGHGKAESLAALAQSTFIIGSASFLLLSGLERLFKPVPIAAPELGIMVSVGATMITFGLVLFQKWVIRKTASPAIAADALHYQSDLLMNVAIIIALGLSWYGWTQADAWFAIAISLFILSQALKMAYEAIQSLLDRQLPLEEQEKIAVLSSSVVGVHGIHQLRTRQAGMTKFIQLHIELDDELPLVDAHTIADEVEDRLLVAFPGADVIIHQDPKSVVPKEAKA